MPAGRRASLLAFLIAGASLAITTATAKAQSGSDGTPPREMLSAVATLSVAGPALQPSLASPGSALPFQLGMGMVAFRWLEPVTMGRFGTWTRMTAPAHAVVQPAWWRRRL